MNIIELADIVEELQKVGSYANPDLIKIEELRHKLSIFLDDPAQIKLGNSLCDIIEDMIERSWRIGYLMALQQLMERVEFRRQQENG